jgi:succinate dehydrogenase/fumarate reductase cytochrome b subunit
METPNDPSFYSEVRRIVWPDIKAALSHRVSLSLEAVVAIPMTYFVLGSLGSAGAAWDFSVEKLIAIPLGVVAVALFHVIAGFLKIPWRLHCEQRLRLIEISDKLSINRQAIADLNSAATAAADTSNTAEQKRLELQQAGHRLELARDAIVQRADILVQTAHKEDIKSYCEATQLFLSDIVKPEIGRKYRPVKFRHNGPCEPDEVTSFNTAVASLRAIAVSLKAEHLVDS